MSTDTWFGSLTGDDRERTDDALGAEGGRELFVFDDTVL